LTAVIDERTGRIMAWKDSIPLHYEYTAGVAGEIFLRALKEGRIIASRCMRCGEVRVPPRTYCLECQARTSVDVELFHYGRIAAISTAHRDVGGARVAAGSRPTFGYVTFEGVGGGMTHKILSHGRRDAKVGDPVAPLFVPREQRRGSILDLAGFRTAVRTRSGND
jgi:uncharacterized OB-fold protein